MADSEHDDEFEAYLKRRAPIDQRMGSPERLEPPAELDHLVIGKARRAIQPPTTIRPYRSPRWALPMGLAATLLVSFCILLDIGVRANKHRTMAGTSAAVIQPAAVVLPTPNIATEPWTAEPQAATVQASRAQSNEAELTFRAKTRSRVARIEEAAKRIDADVATPIVVASAAPAPVAHSAASPAASAAVAPVAAVAAPPAAVATAEPAAAPLANPATAWLERIYHLRSEGHASEADVEMKRFRDAYPDYPLPVTSAAADAADDRAQ